MRKNGIERTAETVGRFAFHAVRKTANFGLRMAWKATKGLTKGAFKLSVTTVKFGVHLHKQKQAEKERILQLDKQEELQQQYNQNYDQKAEPEMKQEVHHHHHYYEKDTRSYQQTPPVSQQILEKPAFQRQMQQQKVVSQSQEKPALATIDRANTKQIENKLEAREKRMRHIIELAKTQRNISQRDYNSDETKQNAKDMLDIYRKEFDILRNEGNVPLTFDPGSKDFKDSVNYYTKSGLAKDQPMTSMQKGFIEAVNFGQDTSTFKHRFQDKYDVLLMDVAKMSWALENATSEKEKSYFAGRIVSMVTEENVKEIRELKIPRRQRSYAPTEYRAASGDMRVREVSKEKEVIQEARLLGKDIVEFAKQYSAEKTKAAQYTKERSEAIAQNAKKQNKNLYFASQNTQKTFEMGRGTYMKPKFEPEMF